MPESDDPKKVSNNDLHNAQFGGGFINADTVNAQRIGGDVWNVFLGRQEAAPLQPPSRQEYRNRQALLNKVNNYWVKGVLEKALHNQVLIELGLEERPDAIAHPWNLLDNEQQPLPQNTKIIEVFGSMGEGRSLLILGDPGSGKTTSLLELTRDLIARAQASINHLIPVVFNLSSWKIGKQAIADWLVEELNTKYQVPKKMGQFWIRKQQLILLLDGLDEVRSELREECLAALNAFYQEYSPEIVVCSRSKDYEALSNRLNFQSAVYLRSLTLEQVYDYLNIVSYELRGLKALIKEDTALQELAKSPLMLNIMILTYQGVAIEDLPKTTIVKERRQQLFDAYIEQMFKHRESNQQYKKKQATHWLTWLAQQMKQESQTIFLIERMQPNCLQNQTQIIVFRLTSLLVSVLIGDIVYQRIYIIIHSSYFTYLTIIYPSFHLSYNNIFFLILGFLVGLGNTGIKGGIIGLVLGLITGIYKKEIKPVENFNWEQAKKNLLNFVFNTRTWTVTIGLIVCLMTAGIYVLLGELLDGRTLQVIIVSILGLIAVTIYGLCSVILPALTSLDIEIKSTPNQGIRKSFVNAILGGVVGLLISGISIGLMAGLIYADLNPISENHQFVYILNILIIGLSVGITFGLIVGGGKACIQHFTLRLILCDKGYIPWNYIRFLNYASERIFLQKVGGGYIFIHRLLMEHFAAMKLE